MDIISVLKNRRSTRRFLRKDVECDLVKEIIKMGTFAPTACNRQAWRFIVVTDEKIKTTLRDSGGSPIIAHAPVGILVLYHRFTTNFEYADNIESASVCMQNMLLAATHLGVASCWINHLPSKNIIRRLFKIPNRYDIIGYITLGYAEFPTKEIPRKYSLIDELISFNRFKAEREIEKRGFNKLAIIALSILLSLYYASPRL